MMKLISKTLTLLSIFVLVLGLNSCSNDDDGAGTPPSGDSNIVETALSDPELTLLVAALQAADGNLVDLLQTDGPFTVLAPTNAAFTAFLNANGFGSIDDVPSDVLEQVLLYHVISGSVRSTDLAAEGYTAGNAQNADGDFISIYYNTTAGVRFNNAAAVTASGADITASNGVIHKIDAVLTLPDVVDHAIANANFSTLVTALGLNGGALIDVLRGDGPFTVLAPTNTAFADFLGETDPGSIPVSVLTNVLSNHVIVGSAIASGDLVDAGSGYANTAGVGPNDNNLSLYFDATDGVTFNGYANVAIADVVGTNGTIHAVDAVIDIPTVVTFAAADPLFSTLVTALTDLTPNTDFVSILSRTEGDNLDGINPDFTVFAPTNDAFAALDEIPGETVLTQVLLHHVISEANVTSGDLTNPGDTTAATLQGQDITITLPGTDPNIADMTDGAGNMDIGIIAVDVQAGNGVIHVINKVLLPNLD